ncbi:TetR/AcrR family transcriptional regulator [Mycobacterium asiaticum]|uniref:TetR family transcriptional regulator n=1 Tax=Mycobacterium asiaticum TaxID=1790 RepID=A0A1A3NG08_MYCAS|nr:helix-turn-helix domain-containing protein [Mycobacterium asiaticum]OBK20721.1 TetR family transcriptional regulator [Mycobacterium asiaticum]
MTTRSANASRGQIPTGREEVAAAVLQAAADLFAERGPAATSIRDIAARSKVNHGLVFRHFGTKDQLVGAVLDHLGTELTTLLQSNAEPDVLDRAMDRQMRVWARALLDGYSAEQLQTRFPNVVPLLDYARTRHDKDSDARMAVANALALQLGWRLFEPMLRSATGLDELTDADLRQAVIAEATQLIEPH